MRILPTICVHMWSVAAVSAHSAKGNAGQPSSCAAHHSSFCALTVFWSASAMKNLRTTDELLKHVSRLIPRFGTIV